MKSSNLLRKVIAISMVLALTVGTGIAAPAAQVIGTNLSVSAAETWGDYEYEVLEDNTIRLTSYHGTAESVVIPSKINDVAVTEIGSHAFYENKTMRSLTIPSGVKVIRERAFQYCENLKSVSLPNGLTTIEDGGFEFCYSLKSVSIPSTVKDMGIYVFQNDKNLTSVTLSSTMTYLPDNAFNECSSLTEITIPDAVERIGSLALSNCRSLKKINFGQNTKLSYLGNSAFSGSSMENFVIPDSVTEVSEGIFCNCYSLKSVTIGSGMTYLPYEMFANCPELESFTIPDTVTGMGWRCFRDCRALKTVHLSENMEEIPGEAFSSCTALTDVYMGRNIHAIGENAFADCTKLANFYNIPQGNINIHHSAMLNTKWYADQEDGPVYFGNVLYNYKGSMAENTSVTVPESTVYLSEQTFRTNQNLKSVTLPASLEEVDFRSVFDRSTNLEAIHIAEDNPNYKSVDGIVYTKDGIYMVYCPKGKTGAVTLPEGVEYINYYDYPLRNCNKITSLTFSSTLRDFYSEDFTTMKALEAIHVPSDNVGGYVSVDGVLYGTYTNDEGERYPGILYCCPPARKGECTVLEGVQELHWSAFKNASQMTELHIPASVRYFMSLENLRDADSLTAVNISDDSENESYCTKNGILYNKDMTTMYYVPNGKTGEITIPESVMEVYSDSFYRCSKLTKVYLPAALTNLSEGLFDTCTSLTGIYVDENNEAYTSENGVWMRKNEDNSRRILCVPKALTSYTLPDDILNNDYIRYEAFDNCALQTLHIPASFDGAYWWWSIDHLFHNLKSLKEIHVDENHTTYRSINGVLYNKEKTEILVVPAAYEGVLELPASIRSLRYEAFSNCTGITEIRFPKSYDGTVDFNIFNNCTALSNISFANHSYYQVVNGAVYNTDMTELYFVSNAVSGEFIVPDTVTSMNESAFLNCTQLTKISFPQGMKRININLSNCSSLQTVEIPASVAEISGEMMAHDEYNNSFYSFAIEGYEGSFAERYANRNDIPFKRLANIITLDKTEVTTAVDRTVKLTPTIKADNTFDKTVTFTSENPNIASVAADGTVTAIAPGTVKIIAATYNGKTASCLVTVNPSLSATAVLSDDNILVNGSITINASAQGGVGGYTYTFYTKTASASSYNTLKTSSEPKAVFTPKQAGTYNIKVMVTDGEKYTAEQILTVQVNNAITNVSTLSAEQSVLGNAVTVNGLSENGLGGTTYQYEYKLASANAWTVLSAYSTASSVSFKPSAAGTYNLRVIAKDSGGNTDVKELTLTVAGKLANNSTLSAESVILGDTVTVNGTASGGAGGYTYAYYLRHADDTKWTTLAGFGTKTSVQTTPSKTGVYQVCIKVKDQEGTVASSYLFLNVGEVLKNISTVSSDHIVQGDTVTVNAAASDGKGDYTYAVSYKKASDTKWTVKQDYSDNTSVNIKPAMATDYMIKVQVKDSAGTVVEKILTVQVNNSITNVSTLSAQKSVLGDAVTVNGLSENGLGGTTYQYEYKLASANAWTVLSAYSTASSVSFKPSAAGTYNLRVIAKDSGGNTDVKELTLTVAGKLANNSTLSAESVMLGDTVTVNGTASGGAGGYTYAYYLRHADDTKWTTLSGFGTKTSVQTTPSKTGVYQVCIKVKDQEGTVASSYLFLSVGEVLKNVSTVSSDNIVQGDTVTVNAAASDGKGDYTYAVSYKKASDTKWTVKQDYADNTSVNIKPAMAADYMIKVQVKDSAGTVAEKILTVKVNKKVQNLSTVSAETIVKGDSVVIKGSASDGMGSRLYQYEYKLASAKTWTLLQDYSEDTAVVLKPSAAGDYEVRVTVKDAANTTAAKTLTFSVTGELTCLSTISAQRIVLGGKITMNSTASGGAGNYTYAYYIKHFDDAKWTAVSGFSDKTSVEYTPKKTGYYLVCIKGKDSAGTVVKEYMNLLVSKKLQNDSTVSAETIPFGNTVTVNAAASEGVGGYTYAVFYKKTTDTKWLTKQSYSANAVIEVKPSKIAEYQICVKVKDAGGTISKKYFTINVTKE